VLNSTEGSAVTWFGNVSIYLIDDAHLLDMWICSSNQTIEQLFKTKEIPANIKSSQKINPTLWKVEVNAVKPFMLSFAETYDSLWEARVYKNGTLVEVVKPIPVYGIINGFWINETGNLTIIVEYKPQDWFELGFKISGTTFILCMAYLFYDWRRDRGERWAVFLSRRVRMLKASIKRKMRLLWGRMLNPQRLK